jgi:toxin ParE1/3/4
MSYAVVFAPEAQAQLLELFNYVAEQATLTTAQRYTDAIVLYCEGLSQFAHRGAARDDIRPGLRITNYKGRAVIAFHVDEVDLRVSVLGVFYGGQDHEAMLRDEPLS